MRLRFHLLTLPILLACQSSGQPQEGAAPALAEALRAIHPEAIRAHLEFLADDALEGRGTGTRGYDLAAKYVRAQFAALRLKSGTKDGSFFQPVALRRTDVDADATALTIQQGDRESSLIYNKDFILLDTHLHSTGSVSAPVVFVGYGVTAPEFDYDDYAGVDAKGKIVALLAFEAPASLPPTERAYYMSGETKREVAAAHGAVGIIEINTPEMEQRFPWDSMLREVKIGFNSLRWLDSVNRPFGLDEQIKAFAHLNGSGALALLAGEQRSLDEVFAGAKAGKPGSFPLTKSVRIQYRARHSPVNSVNVVGVLPGSDPNLRNKSVVFTAHLDHIGIGPPVDGDNIYNGALDNAAGSAVLLEVARFFASLPAAPRRSVIFAALTGEEEGLLGSQCFANDPPLPGPVVADINVDGGAFFFPMKDVTAYGEEHSSLSRLARRAASHAGFQISPDPMPDEGFFVRADQYSFVKAGIPSLYLDLGYKTDQPGADPLAALKKWLVTIYHSPKDDASQPIDYETSARFARFAALVTYYTADDIQSPAWNTNDFFGKKFCKPGSLACPKHR